MAKGPIRRSAASLENLMGLPPDDCLITHQGAKKGSASSAITPRRCVATNIAIATIATLIIWVGCAACMLKFTSPNVGR
jgi:hypothetical protein